MTSADDQNPAPGNAHKLEKSLDAVAALRKAMEQRLAEARAEAEARKQAVGESPVVAQETTAETQEKVDDALFLISRHGPEQDPILVADMPTISNVSPTVESQRDENTAAQSGSAFGADTGACESGSCPVEPNPIQKADIETIPDMDESPVGKAFSIKDNAIIGSAANDAQTLANTMKQAPCCPVEPPPVSRAENETIPPMDNSPIGKPFMETTMSFAPHKEPVETPSSLTDVPTIHDEEAPTVAVSKVATLIRDLQHSAPAVVKQPAPPMVVEQRAKTLDAISDKLAQIAEKARKAAEEKAAAPIVTPAPKAEAPKVEAAKVEAPKAEAAPKAEKKADKKGDAKAAEGDDHPLNFDPIEWSKILFRVVEEDQKLISGHIDRMRAKPLNTISFSPAPMIESMSQLMTHIINDPQAFTNAQLSIWQGYVDIARSTLMRMQPVNFFQQPTVAAAPKSTDRRFQSKEWQNNWMFDYLRQTYQTTVDETQRLVKQETENVENKMAKKIEFYTRLFLDATAPSNFWLTNPEVLRETWNTRGENLVKGLKNLLSDIERGNGMLMMRMSDYQAFEIGKNIAATPGKVVFQNELMQLIQYSPSTPSVKSVPMLIVPPWINKFYILDLREKNSLLRYMVSQGFTVFCVSWVNPTKQHAGVTFEDYMGMGILPAMRAVKRQTGSDKINLTGYCVGGTLLASTLAHLAKRPAEGVLPEVASATFLTSLTDFTEPGDLGVFIDEEQISMLEERMARQGFMDAGSMMMTFNLLRSAELFWPFFINNYLMGREPFPFDILYWNTDSTNLPAAMHSYYLRNMYLHNKLVKPNALTMMGTPIDLTQVKVPVFMLSTREDHIAPWKSTYAATQLYKGPVKFVLSGSGHIAGVVNPPAAEKYGYWTNENNVPNTDEWLKNATEHKGSWWPEWCKWLEQYSGETIPASEVPNGIEEAPGSYVRALAI